jgi:hypothetical protein
MTLAYQDRNNNRQISNIVIYLEKLNARENFDEQLQKLIGKVRLINVFKIILEYFFVEIKINLCNIMS